MASSHVAYTIDWDRKGDGRLRNELTNAMGEAVTCACGVFGNRASMTTYRNEDGTTGDTTSWTYDEATGLLIAKTYADGKGPSYSYTPNGNLATRTWARGVFTTYTYDDWGNLTRTDYSDGTPSVVLSYDAMGRQTRAIDAAGVTTFAYDSFGSLTNETVVGVAGRNTIERFSDSFGRDAGYALNGVRQSMLGYDPATGRLASMQIWRSDVLVASNETTNTFTWNYLAGGDLKSSLAYPNGVVASWTYDSRNNLLQVCNTRPVSSSPSMTSNNVEVILKYVYTYDALGRRIGCDKSGSAFTTPDTYAYLYNVRSELTNATAAVDAAYRYGYRFDDIGNREISSERGTNRTYVANSLNQYTAITSQTLQTSQTFRTSFDADGNQTLVKTSTGSWQITYNGENRPILWTQGTNTIAMSYDRMGRRVTKNDQRFVYNGYLQISDNSGNTCVWDPSEPFATRPLVWGRQPSVMYYAHDGIKNVSELVSTHGLVMAHYEYSPFGAVFSWSGAFAAFNPWRFSCECAEDDTATVYYNYRHYEVTMGRWLTIDFLDYIKGYSPYRMLLNNAICEYDILGLRSDGSSRFRRNRQRRKRRCKKIDVGKRICSGVEECRTKIPRIGYTPTKNGCGSGWSKYLVPDRDYLSWLAFEDVDFTSACDKHDECFGTCGNDRLECNRQLEGGGKRVRAY